MYLYFIAKRIFITGFLPFLEFKGMTRTHTGMNVYRKNVCAGMDEKLSLKRAGFEDKVFKPDMRRKRRRL